MTEKENRVMEEEDLALAEEGIGALADLARHRAAMDVAETTLRAYFARARGTLLCDALYEQAERQGLLERVHEAAALLEERDLQIKATARAENDYSRALVENDYLRKKLANAEEQASNLREQLETEIKKLHQHEKRANRYEKRITHLQRKNDELRSVWANCQAKIEGLKTHNANLRGQLASEVKDSQRHWENCLELRKTIKKLEQEISECKSQLRWKNVEIRDLNKTISNLHKKIEEMARDLRADLPEGVDAAEVRSGSSLPRDGAEIRQALSEDLSE